MLVVLKGSGKIVSSIAKTTGKKMAMQIMASPNFVASTNFVERKTISFKEFIPRFNVYTDGDTISAGKSFVYLIANSLDPGVSVLINSKKIAFEFGGKFASGNVLAAFTHISSNWKNLVEASIRVNSGRVDVTDRARHRTVTVRAGHRVVVRR